MISTFLVCTAGKTVSLPSILNLSAVSGSYLRPGTSKSALGKGPTPSGGQECIRKDHYIGKIACG